ncbi:MAG: UDP-N-acetylmuramate dehydrogenase [Candidatus Eremiobacteraeota bacterium]|nr:UDP-N-acetylmuramate dehydrogenase [Candidatus Eremiobacteraeota bacterium]MBC5827368.1 UDP-N-acetylmuramate dehydrogenase [Candidatus Eremiobacteraeota bacterium]
MIASSGTPGLGLDEFSRVDLRSLLGAAVSFDEPLARRTSMRIGGPAAAFAVIKNVRDLAALLRWCKAERRAWTIFGLGSNLLVADAGFPGVAIRLAGDFTRVVISDTLVSAGAAVPVLALCREAAKAGLRGAEALVGIPGTVGGAVRMNAGTDLEIGALVERVEVMLPGEDARTVATPDFAYRRCSLAPDAVVCGAQLRLKRGDTKMIGAELRRRIVQRNATQPVESPNAGSIFRNPPGDHAARLIETAGCKGRRIGDAEVSVKHANFIVNRKAATCRDVLALIEDVRAAVERAHGIELQLEVHVL